jgi:carboxypeptidase Q
MLSALQRDALDNVHAERVSVPHWERGVEECTLTSPRHHKMSILGLGRSVGTPSGGIHVGSITLGSSTNLLTLLSCSFSCQTGSITLGLMSTITSL